MSPKSNEKSNLHPKRRVVGRPFKKGHRFSVGNRGGPGGARNMKAVWEKKRLLDSAVSNDDWQRIFAEQRDKAIGGSTEAAKFLVEHRWGKPAQDVNVGGQNGETLSDILKALVAAKTAAEGG